MNKNLSERRLIYGPDDKPPFWQALALGFQQLLVLSAGLIILPIIIANAFNLDTINVAYFLSCTWLGVGISTLIQTNTKIGSMLPLVQGPSFSFIAPAFAVAGVTNGGIVGIATFVGGIILGGLTEALVGVAKLVGLVKRFITPLTMGIVITLIALGLFKVYVDFGSSNWILTFIIFGIGLSFSVIIGKKKPSMKMFSILIAFSIGYLICLIATILNLVKPESALYLNFEQVKAAPWFILPVPFRWGMPKFTLSAYLVLLAGYISSIVESVGDYHNVAYISEMPPLDSETINKGIRAEGLGSLISGIFGGSATTSYTENIGAIAITGVASRYIFAFTGVFTILLSCIYKFGIIFATIPKPVIGGLLFLAGSMIVGAGIECMTRVDIHSSRNLSIIGFSLLLGLGIPYYIETHPIIIKNMVWLANVFNGILSTPMAVGLIVSMTLDNLLPRLSS